MTNEMQYFKIEKRGVDDTFERTLVKQCVYQTKPFGAVEITEEEFTTLSNRNNVTSI